VEEDLMKIKILVVLALLGGFSWFTWQRLQPEKPVFKQVALTQMVLRNVIAATGTVEPQNRLEVKPQVSGRLEKILVKEGDAVTKGQVLAWMSSTERAALLDAARMQDEAGVAYWENVYKPTPLISPITGEVIVRKLEPGQTIGLDTPVVVLSDRLIVKAQVDETDIGKVRVGQEVEITLEAYPDTLIKGRVVHIAYESKIVSNVTIYEVEIAPLSTLQYFRSGMGANVSIIEKQAQVLALPVEAVSSNVRGAFVLVQGQDGPRPQKVKTGMTDDKMIEIVSGLAQTDQVLVKETRSNLNRRRTGTSPFVPNRRPRL
jgi:macrolide-specific efflux system membrane fusion protein